jgi:hypothetical protein
MKKGKEKEKNPISIIKIDTMENLESMKQSLISNYIFSVSFWHLAERLNIKPLLYFIALWNYQANLFCRQ